VLLRLPWRSANPITVCLCTTNPPFQPFQPLLAPKSCGNPRLAVPLLRAYNPIGLNHFYTINVEEFKNAITKPGYINEGTTGCIFPSHTVTLYRMFHPAVVDHFYTTSVLEPELWPNYKFLAETSRIRPVIFWKAPKISHVRANSGDPDHSGLSQICRDPRVEVRPRFGPAGSAWPGFWPQAGAGTSPGRTKLTDAARSTQSQLLKRPVQQRFSTPRTRYKGIIYVAS